MVLVDTSVIIGLLKRDENEAVDKFRHILDTRAPYAISVLTYQEVLQGAQDIKEMEYLKEYLSSLKIYHLPKSLDFYGDAAHYRNLLRTKGITIRNTIDILIASTCIYYDLELLHNDKDYDFFAKYIEKLVIYN